MSGAGKLAAILSAGVDLKSAVTAIEPQELSAELKELIRQAREFGAPVSLLCRQYEAFERSRADFALEISQAQAVPRATRKLMLWLPALSLVIGQLVGMNPLSALASPIGIASMAIAGLLIWAGSTWSAALLKPLAIEQEHPGRELLLFRMALDSGLGLSAAISRAGHPKDLDSVLSMSRSTGAPIGALLDSEIASLAAHQASQAISQAREMSIKLLIPLALTLLPAFLILTLFPMLIGITKS